MSDYFFVQGTRPTGRSLYCKILNRGEGTATNWREPEWRPKTIRTALPPEARRSSIRRVKHDLFEPRIPARETTVSRDKTSRGPEPRRRGADVYGRSSRQDWVDVSRNELLRMRTLPWGIDPGRRTMEEPTY